MSIRIMNMVWESPLTHGSDRLVLLALADQANDEGVCWPSIGTIAKKVNLSRRYVIDILSQLEKEGHIQITSRLTGEVNRNQSNIYRVTPRLTSEEGLTTPSEETLTRLVRKPSPRVVRKPSPKPPIEPPFNPQSETVNNNFAEISKLYEQEFGPLTAIISDKITDLLKDYPFDWIKEAIIISATNGKRNLGYATAILKRWKVDGYGVDNRAGGNGKAKTDTTDYSAYINRPVQPRQANELSQAEIILARLIGFHQSSPPAILQRLRDAEPELSDGKLILWTDEPEFLQSRWRKALENDLRGMNLKLEIQGAK